MKDKYDDRSAQLVEYGGEKYYFCCSNCRKDFEKDPEKYLARSLFRRRKL